MSSKKVVIEKIISSGKSEENPIVLNFQNQQPDLTKCNCIVVEDWKKGRKTALLSTNDKNLYQGDIGADFPTNLVNNFIVIRNKTTNKVRFVEVDQVSLKNIIYEQNNQTSENTHLINGDEELKRKLLLKNFGGRKAIRGLDKAERMKMNVDVVKDQLNKSLNESALANTSDIYEKSSLDSTYLDEIQPPHNKSAKTLDEIYSLDDLIPRELLNKLEDETEAILGTNIEDIPITSEMIRQKIVDIQKLNDRTEQNKDTVKSLIYMDGLANLVKTKCKSLKNAPLSEITEKVENDICRRFKQKGLIEENITTFTKQKAFTYFLALAYVTTGVFELNLELLTQALSLPEKKIIDMAKLCNSKINPKTKTLCLFLPGKVKLPGPKKFHKGNH